MNYQINKKRKAYDITDLTIDFHDKLSFDGKVYIRNENVRKKIKITHKPSDKKIKEIKSTNWLCIVHHKEDICSMYGCAGVKNEKERNLNYKYEYYC
jgi:hypothetical protein